MPKVTKPKTRQARALLDLTDHGIRCKSGHVFEADDKVIDALIASGQADDNDEAVAAGLAENSEVAKQTLDDLAEALDEATDQVLESTQTLQDVIKEQHQPNESGSV